MSKADSVIELDLKTSAVIDVENLSQEHQRSGLTQPEYP